MSSRPETGPMQFGDDWTGVFIRGDNALLGYALPLQEVIDGHDHPLSREMLRGLLEVLRSCEQGKSDEVQRLPGIDACREVAQLRTRLEQAEAERNALRRVAILSQRLRDLSVRFSEYTTGHHGPNEDDDAWMNSFDNLNEEMGAVEKDLDTQLSALAQCNAGQRVK